MEAAGYLDTTSGSMVQSAWLPYLEDLTFDELKQVKTFIEFLRAKRKSKSKGGLIKMNDPETIMRQIHDDNEIHSTN